MPWVQGQTRLQNTSPVSLQNKKKGRKERKKRRKERRRKERRKGKGKNYFLCMRYIPIHNPRDGVMEARG